MKLISTLKQGGFMHTIFKPTIKKVMSYSALLLLTASFTTINTVEAAPASIHQLESEEKDIMELLSEQEVTLSEVSELMSVKENEILILMDDISEKEEELKQMKEKIDEKDNEINELEKEIKITEEKLKEKIQQYEDNIEIASDRAVALQTQDKDKVSMYVDILLNTESLSDMFAGLRAVNLILDAHEKQIISIEEQADEIRALDRKLNSEKENLLSEKRDLQSLQSELNDEQKQLIADKEEVEVIISGLDKQRRKIQEEYNYNLDDLYSVKETKSGIRMLESMQMNEQNRATISSSSASSINASLNEIRSGQRDKNTVSQVINEGRKHIGVPYVWGGTTTSGFDCSGLTQFVYRKAGINLPRTSSQQANVGQAISVADAQPGDLLFWDRGGKVYHVAIYIGNGDFIHAPRPGKSVNITNVKYFTPSSARRVIPNQSVPKKQKASNTSKGSLIGTFSATAYAVGGHSVPGTVTANGTDVSNTIYTNDGHRIIAVDPNVIPMNSIVVVDIPGQEPFTAKASDTGGAIKGNIIDLLLDSPNKTRGFGRKQGVKIYKHST